DPGVVDEEGFEAAVPQGVLLRLDDVRLTQEAVPARRVREVDFERGGDDVKPVVVEFRRGWGILLGDDVELRGEGARRGGDGGGAGGHNEAAVAFGAFVGRGGVSDGRAQLLTSEGKVDPESTCRHVQPREEAAVGEGLPAEDAEVLPDAVAVEEPVVERAQ